MFIDIYQALSSSELKILYTPFSRQVRGMRARPVMPKEIKTPRFLLKIFSESDAAVLSQLISNEHLQSTTLGFTYPYTLEMAKEYILNIEHAWQSQTGFYYGVYDDTIEHNHSTLVGGVSLVVNHGFGHGELGYWVGEPYWGKGIATEIAHVVAGHGLYSLSLNRIYAQHLSNNERSGAIMRKIGMRLEGIFRQHIHKNRNWYDVFQYAIIKKDLA